MSVYTRPIILALERFFDLPGWMSAIGFPSLPLRFVFCPIIFIVSGLCRKEILIFRFVGKKSKGYSPKDICFITSQESLAMNPE